MCVSVFRRLVPIGVVRVPGCGHGYPQPGLLSYISTVCSADHIPLLPPLLLLSRPALSLCWFSAPNFPRMAPRLDACVRRLWPMVITLRHPPSIHDRLLQFHF